MDRSDVVRCALQGAAKVAFSAALVACGGVTIEETPSLTTGGAGGQTAATSGASTTTSQASNTSSPASTSASASTASSGGAGGGDGSCHVESGPPFADTTITCCNDLVEATFPADMPTTTPPAPASPELVACCGVALEARDHPAVNGPTPVPWESGYECCAIPGVQKPKPFSSTCSPWGPPSPPAMPDDLVWLEEAA
jgi:hypothetical protein